MCQQFICFCDYDDCVKLVSFQKDSIYFNSCKQIIAEFPYLKLGLFTKENGLKNSNTNSLQQIEYVLTGVNLVLLKEKKLNNYLHSSFLQNLQINGKDYFISEIWITKHIHLHPCILFVPKDCKELIEEYNNNYLLQNENIIYDDNFLLTKKFFNTCPILQKNEFVTKVSSSVYPNILITTNLNNLYKIYINNDTQSFECIPLQFDYPINDIQVYTGGNFHIVTCQNNLTNEINVYGIGDNYYSIFGEATDSNLYKNSLFKMTKLSKIQEQPLQSNDFFSGSWDNIFLVKNNGKELYGCGRNYGNFFCDGHRRVDNFTLVDLSNLLFENEKILRVHGTDDKAIVLLSSGDVLVNRYLFSTDKSDNYYESVIVGTTFVRLKRDYCFKGLLVIDAVTTRDNFICLLSDYNVVTFERVFNSELKEFKTIKLNLEKQLERNLKNGYEFKLFGFEFGWSIIITTLEKINYGEKLFLIEGLKDIDLKF
ncbi:hypothetical protein ABK040_006089 [Willaertia magna]